MTSSFTLAVLCSIGLGFAVVTGASTAEPTTEIEDIVQRFGRAIDEQDAEVAERLLQTHSAQFVVSPEGLRTVSKPQYLELLRDKKIGGIPAETKIDSINVSGTAASARMVRTLRDRGFVFTHFVSMLRVEGEWKVVSVTAAITRLTDVNP